MHFTVYDIRDCLYDNRRTRSFAQAIGQMQLFGTDGFVKICPLKPLLPDLEVKL
ncbi:MAG: hypothetical protein Q8P32_02810 [Candidatus Komeilibacteria bacterium]|nr:hypothetical protein [Candidatus Komeilibacteria bacterium]